MTGTTLELHPWNVGFEWRPTPRAGGILSARQAEDFDRHGFTVVEEAFDADAIAAARAEIDPFVARTDELVRERFGGRASIAESGAIMFSPHLVTESSLLSEFVAHPLFAALARDLVGPDVNLYWDQAVYKLPEKPRRFPWHQDNGYTFVEPQQYLTCWVPLVDATVENGCPQVVPGAHRMGTLIHRWIDPLGWECCTDPEVVVPVPARIGSVVVFSSLTPHLTGPNLTDETRKAYIVQYCDAGARILTGDPRLGAPTGTRTCDDPDRQFAVVRNGVRSRIGGTSRSQIP